MRIEHIYPWIETRRLLESSNRVSWEELSQCHELAACIIDIAERRDLLLVSESWIRMWNAFARTSRSARIRTEFRSMLSLGELDIGLNSS